MSRPTSIPELYARSLVRALVREIAMVGLVVGLVVAAIWAWLAPSPAILDTIDGPTAAATR